MISRDRMKFSDIERSFPGVAYERAQGFRVRVRLPHGEIWSTRVMSGMYDVRDTRDLSWSWSVLVGTRPGRFGHAGATHSDVLTRVHDRGADEWYIRSNSPIHPSPPGCGVDIRDATAVSSRPSHHPPPEYEWPLLSLEPRRHRRPRLRVQRCAKPPLAPPRQLAQCGRSRQVQAARPARSPDEGKPLAWTLCVALRSSLIAPGRAQARFRDDLL